ncbi:MAG TPA: S9 family peptidase [Thermoanaerobaculia bacterium]|nr:S9 family peptidase [Thermoanaerobaculia bacterium]
MSDEPLNSEVLFIVHRSSFIVHLSSFIVHRSNRMIAILLATLTIQDYATLPLPSSPRWSPDGRRIAYVLTKADLEKSAYDSNVRIIDADGTNDRQLTFARGADFRPRWSPDGKTIAFLSDRDGKNAVWLLDPDGGEARKLVDPPAAVRDFEWSPDGKSIAFTRIDEPAAEETKRAAEKDDARVVGEGAKRVHLYLAEVGSGAVRRLTTGGFSIFTFSWSPDGTQIAFDRGPGTGLDDLYRTDIYAVSVATGELKPLVVRPGAERSPVYSPDGKWLAFTSWGGVHDWLLEQEVHVMPAGGGEPRNVAKAYDRTPEAIFWSGGQLYVEGAYNTTTQLYRVNADGSGWTDTTQAAGVIGDPDVARGRAAYIYQSTSEPPELYAGDAGRGSPKQLTHHNDAYRSRELGETRVIRWKNPKDGLEIEGLLTLPVGYKSGRVPLLTFVHGGPASRFDQGYLGYLGWIYAPQVLAAHGFAVLRPNPRGTGGYGSAFRSANRNDWGGMDWIDINAGIDHLIATGIADPGRLGLMGWSYGGFMAAWAIGHSDRFQAVSVGAPVVDLLSFHGTADIRDFIPDYFRPWSLDALRARSPLWNLKKTRAKVLIQHGEADDRVPMSQGTMLYRSLDELGVDVTMVTYPRTPHIPREPKLRMDIMKRNLELFLPLRTLLDEAAPR